jgi:Rod binding domain-containing protein
MAELGMAQLVPLASTGLEARKPDSPARVRDAAQQFEALLVAQILRSVRESGGGWLGGGDSAGDCATEFAEQHLATVLSQAGGLGLAELIAAGLKSDR